MSYTGCVRPLKAFPIGLTENGKIDYKIKKYEIDHIELSPSGIWRAVKSPFREFSDTMEIVKDFIELPCGSCVNCRLNRARQWSHRCVCESFSHKHNYFLTLTYDPKYLPVNGSLCKRDLQLFWKNLRYYNSKGLPFLDDDFKYFACGEYGTEGMRPHYHALCFGLNLIHDDLKFYKIHNGHPLYNSSLLDSIWQKGFVTVGELCEATCNYVARYTYKKTTLDPAIMQEFYNATGVDPEFTCMSRRPGIASDWINLNWEELYKQGYICYSTADGGRRIYPTRYFMSKLEKLDPQLFEEVKFKAKEYQLNKKEILFKNDKRPYLDILRDQEQIRLSQTKSLLERSSFDA